MVGSGDVGTIGGYFVELTHEEEMVLGIEITFMRGIFNVIWQRVQKLRIAIGGLNKRMCYLEDEIETGEKSPFELMDISKRQITAVEVPETKCS